VMWEFMNLFDRKNVIVTHDSGSPRNQLVPFYQAPVPRSYLGWGKSHALGGGLGLIIGAKLAAPEKFCVNFMGDAAFGMTGLDFETAVRNNIPILTVVLNNNFMAAETHSMKASHERYGTMNILGNYADLAKSLGLGLRARTPLGLLRFDAAYPLDRRPGEPGYKLYVGFGNAF